jgi:hypothetical protein
MALALLSLPAARLAERRTADGAGTSGRAAAVRVVPPQARVLAAMAAGGRQNRRFACEPLLSWVCLQALPRRRRHAWRATSSAARRCLRRSAPPPPRRAAGEVRTSARLRRGATAVIASRAPFRSVGRAF